MSQRRGQCRHRRALRAAACIVNFHTDGADLDAVPEIVVRRGRAPRDELRAVDTTM